MSLTLLLTLSLGSIPIDLPQVRGESRDHNSVAVLQGLTHDNATAGVALARSQILPQLYLASAANFSLQGPQNQTNIVPSLNPDLSISYTRQTITIPTSSYGFFDTSLNVAQLIYDGGKWWNTIAQAGDQERAALNFLDEQRNVSEFEGVHRFYELIRAVKTAEVFEATVKRSAEQLDRARSMFEAGRVLKGDVFAAQVTLGTDQTNLLNQKQLVTNARADLAVWLGHPGADGLQAVTPAALEREPGSAPELDASLQQARQNRPLLRELADLVQVADLGVSLARSAYLPKLTGFAQLGRNGPGVDPVYTTPNRQNYMNLGLNLHWDLFSGFATDAAVEQARIAKTQAEVNLAEGVREVEADVAKTLANVDLALQRWHVAQAASEAAHQGLDLAGERYKAGAGSFLEIQDAQLKVTQTEQQVISSRIDIEIARANVDRVLGRSGVIQ